MSFFERVEGFWVYITKKLDLIKKKLHQRANMKEFFIIKVQ